MAEEGNMGLICPQCANSRQESWQEHHASVVVKEYDHALIEFHFTGPDKHEWMWVLITTKHGDSFTGELANDSTFDANFTLGTVVNFKREDIADLIPQGEEDNWKPWRPSTDAHGHHHNHEAKA